MRVAIVGSPRFTDETRVFPIISAFIEDQTHSNVVIVTGNMEGAGDEYLGHGHNYNVYKCSICGEEYDY